MVVSTAYVPIFFGAGYDKVVILINIICPIIILMGMGNVLGTQSEIKKITLTAKEYGDLSFSITSDKEKYMLGRSANQSEFLAQDRRVGNEHCYLFYQDGYWLVKDNNSKK